MVSIIKYRFAIGDALLGVDDANLLEFLFQIIKTLILPLQALKLGFLLIPDIFRHEERLSEKTTLSNSLLNLAHEEEGA